MSNCIHCGSANTRKDGKLVGGGQRRECKDCKKWFSGNGAPRVLLFDIETSHIEFRGWQVGEQYVRPNQVTKTWFTICWSARWLFGDKVFSEAVTPKEALARNDERIVRKLHKYMDEADVVVTQNGDRFDITRMNWLFMKYGLPPNNKYHSIDTYKKSKNLIDNGVSKGLDYVMTELGFGSKSPTEEEDWIKAEAGDAKSIKKLSDYCTNDIYLLEDWYLKLRPWMKTHPNLAPYLDMYYELEDDEGRCPRCLHVLNYSLFNKKWVTPAGVSYKSGSCSHCGSLLKLNRRKKENKNEKQRSDGKRKQKSPSR